jgi:hypothetical protein
MYIGALGDDLRGLAMGPGKLTFLWTLGVTIRKVATETKHHHP